jgi:hypothetical protein
VSRDERGRWCGLLIGQARVAPRAATRWAAGETIRVGLRLFECGEVPYRPQDEHVSVAPPAPGVAAGPDIYGQGLQAHQRLQNHLADLATACGRDPLSASPTEPSYELAWMTDTSVMVVVEVNSSTAGNEVRQLRIGLGHILDDTRTLQRCGHTVQPVLHVEREPADAQRWLDITERTGVLLTWPGTENRLGLPTSDPAAPPSRSVERVRKDNPRW